MDDGAGERAAARARQAGRRAEELKDRRGRLARGEPVTEDDVVDAGEAAGRSRRRDAESSRSAATAHRSAADGHRRAAAQLEESGDPEGAARHRQGAVDDDAAGRRDDSAAVDEAAGAEVRPDPPPT